MLGNVTRASTATDSQATQGTQGVDGCDSTDTLCCAADHLEMTDHPWMMQ